MKNKFFSAIAFVALNCAFNIAAAQTSPPMMKAVVVDE